MTENSHLKEIQRRKRERKIIIFTFVVLIIATIVEVWYAKKTVTNTPIPSNIVVFSLLNINIILTLLLIFLIFRNLVKTFFDKDKVKVKKLSRKLVISFFLFTTIPLLVLFGISTIMLKSSITGWFNKRVEDSLKASLYVAKQYYEEKQEKAITYAKNLLIVYRSKNRWLIDRKAKEYFLNGYIIGKGKKILKINYFPFDKKKYIERARKDIINFVKKNKKNSGSTVIKTGSKELIIGFYKIYPVYSIAVYYSGRKLVKAINIVSRNYSEFSYLKIMKTPIQNTYLLSLLIATMVIIFSATWFGFYIANDITTPLIRLAQVTQEIAKGNLDIIIDIKSADEINILVESFKKMVFEIKTTRKEILERQHYIENIINNINSGVISINKNGIISTINPFAEKVLKINKNELIGLHIKNIRNNLIKNLIEELIIEVTEKNKNINKTITINFDENFYNLDIFTTMLKDEKNDIMGYLIVFNDLTQLTLLQRAAAWREVARKVAHEIKNPLTPIQLSAQRIKKKYSSHITQNKEEFENTLNNIVEYVELIRNMVNEFSKFAKLPDIKTEQYDLNEIIKETIPVYKNFRKDIQFNIVLDENLPKIKIDKKQILQVLSNLLNNSIQAFDSIERENKYIKISTHYNKDIKIVTITIEDNGIGIDKKIKDKIFEPNFSTKKKGTGIGLTIVKSIVNAHNGEIKFVDNHPFGVRVIIELPA